MWMKLQTEMLSTECRMFIDSVDALHRDSSDLRMCFLGSSEIEVICFAYAFKIS